MKINKLRIKNFKSIKDLEIDCKKVNVFIGEPNTGKSNILEALGLLSHISYGELRQFVRFESMMDLFYDRNIGEKILIDLKNLYLEVSFKDGTFTGELMHVLPSGQRSVSHVFSYSYDGARRHGLGRHAGVCEIKFYRFERITNFGATESDFLLPPNGRNLLHVVLTRKELKQALTNLFKKFGYRVVFKPPEGKIEVQKEQEDIITSIPYALASETLQRIAFYLAAIFSNKESVLAFEEPEAHAFPYYMKFLAEKIALDKANNQYFIATHNPYFLTSIIEKTPKDEIATFITYYENYQTKIKMLSGDEVEQALDMGSDVFLNVDQFLKRNTHEGN